MKKILGLLAVVMLSITAASAQSFQKGDAVVSASIGFGGGYGLPITLAYEKGVFDIADAMAIGVGATVGFGVDNEFDWRTSNVLLGANANFHFTGIKKLDLMGGVMLGYDVASVKWKGEGDAPVSGSASDFLFGFTVGARYFLTDRFAVVANAGYGVSNFSVGVGYKF